MGEKMIIDLEIESSVINKPDLPKKALKRKRVSSSMSLTLEEKEVKIKELKEEIEGLFRYYKEVLGQKVVEINSLEGYFLNNSGSNSNNNVLIGVLLEESELPLSKLVDEIYEKLNKRDGVSVTMASVKSSVLFIGQRMMYGIENVDADVLEDDSEACLWCWETRDMKLMPKSIRSMLKIRRTCRKRIHERVSAVSAMLTVLQKSESHQSSKQELVKASEKLNRVLNEADIRSFVDSMVQKNGTDVLDKETKREEKLLIKELEKNKREVEKEKKRMERELQKEKAQSEKELKKMQEDVEVHREKEEAEMRRQRKKQQEGAEKDQRRREKEEAELKKQLALQKQASLMERFLKKGTKSSTAQKDQPSIKAPTSDLSDKSSEKIPEAVTMSMDTALSLDNDINTCHIRSSHLASWRQLGQSIRVNRKQHWGLRRVPKIELIKELKLTASREQSCDNELNAEKLSDGWDVTNSDDRSCDSNAISYSCSADAPKRNRSKQLLQFDKSFRPAFYGFWPKKSNVVGPHHPFRKDPDLDYDIDSDEEWEEEEPGESLSDCDKDDEEESLEDRLTKADDEDASEDGFFVPDGYLSENEGVQVDRTESNPFVEEVRNTSEKAEAECEEFCILLRQQKHLHKLTEHALRKNQPLIISNLMNEKNHLLTTEDLDGTQKSEQTCLQALSMCLFPGGSPIELSVDDKMPDKDQDSCISSTKSITSPVADVTVIPDADLPKVVSAIQSCSQGMNRVVECLQQAFPSTPKSQLRNKVRELSNFVDNRWQVKKHVLDKLGLSPSPEKGNGSTKGIANFFVKRCLPPPGNTINPNETFPQSPQKSVPALPEQQIITYSEL